MALPYPTKVVLPFDIATAQDMNERHANDVALAAGTGLNNGAVTASKIDFSTGIWWEEIGRVEQTSATSSVSVPITQKKFMRVIASIQINSGTNINIFCRPNNVSSSSYGSDYFGLGTTGIPNGASGTFAQLFASTGGDTGHQVHADFTLSRPLGSSSRLTGSGTISVTSPGNSSRKYVMTYWDNTSTAVTNFTFVTSAGNMLGTFVVLGHD